MRKLSTAAVAGMSLLILAACGGPGAEGTAAGEEDTVPAAESPPATSGNVAETGEEASAPSRPEGRASGEQGRTRATEGAGNWDPAATEPAAEEEEPAEAEEPAPTRTVDAGTQMWVSLRDSLDSEHVEVGRRFEAEVVSPVTDGTYVLVPQGAVAFGSVTRVRKARRDSAAMIGLAFDSLRVGEDTYPISATVTDAKIESRSEVTGEGKKIGLGAAAGAVLGAVIGRDVKGAVIGAAGGAAAGTVIALGTQARYAVIPAGSELTLRLDEPLEVQLPR